MGTREDGGSGRLSSAAAHEVLTSATLLREIVRFQSGLPFVLLEFELLGEHEFFFRDFDASQQRVADAVLALQWSLELGRPNSAVVTRMHQLLSYCPEVTLNALMRDTTGRVAVEQLKWFHKRELTKPSLAQRDLRRCVIEAYAGKDDIDPSVALPAVEWITEHLPHACEDVGTAPPTLFRSDQLSYLQRLIAIGAVRIDIGSVATAAKVSSSGLKLPVLWYLLDTFPAAVGPKVVDEFAARGNLGIVRLLMDRPGLHGTIEAMNGAAASGHLATLKFLHGRKREACTMAAMDAAARNGHLEVVAFLHEHRSEGCTVNAIVDAAANGHLAVVRFLLEHGAGTNTMRAMWAASRQGHFEIVRLLYESNPTDWSRGACFYGALEQWELEIVKYACTSKRNTYVEELARAVGIAAGHGPFQRDMLEFLLSLASPKPSIDDCRHYVSALHDAAKRGDFDTFRFFHEHLHPACCPRPGPWSDDIIVLATAKEGHLNILQYYLEHCFMKAREIKITTLSHIAKWPQCSIALQLAWANGADPKWRDTDAVVCAAAEAGNEEAVQLLLDRGSPCSPATLCAAARSGNLDLVQYLMRAYPSDITSEMLGDAARHDRLDVLEWLHTTRHNLCVPSLIDEAIVNNASWCILSYLHLSCPSQSVSPPALKQILYYSRYYPYCDKQARTCAFLVLTRREPSVTNCVRELPRPARRVLLRHIQTRFPGVVQARRHMPWCCQLLALRISVENGEGPVDGTLEDR